VFENHKVTIILKNYINMYKITNYNFSCSIVHIATECVIIKCKLIAITKKKEDLEVINSCKCDIGLYTSLYG